MRIVNAMKLLSVIVPVYNVENYIDECVRSIVSQEYTNLEIILIDDGSTDTSGMKCDKWKTKDNRIKVIHKPNGGLSDARNAGLDIATGEYIGFVDSDDYIEPNMFKMLVDNLEQYNTQISCCRYANVWENGYRETVGEDHQIYFYEGIDGLKEYLYGKTMDPFVCNKLYRADLFTKGRKEPLRFIRGIVGEDNPFNVTLMEQCDSIVLVGESLYNYRQNRMGAITSSGVSQKKIDSVLWWNTAREMCKTRYPELEKYVLRRQVIFYAGLFQSVTKEVKYKDTADDLRRFMKDHLREIIDTDIIEKTVKLSALMMSKCPWAYLIMMAVYKKMVGRIRL